MIFKPQIPNNKTEHLLRVCRWHLFPQTASQEIWIAKARVSSPSFLNRIDKADWLSLLTVYISNNNLHNRISEFVLLPPKCFCIILVCAIIYPWLEAHQITVQPAPYFRWEAAGQAATIWGFFRYILFPRRNLDGEFQFFFCIFWNYGNLAGTALTRLAWL